MRVAICGYGGITKINRDNNLKLLQNTELVRYLSDAYDNALKISDREEVIKMGNFGKCKYCGAELSADSYRMHKEGVHDTPRMLVYCPNDNCPVKPCTNDTYPSAMMEEVKCFAVAE